MPSCTARTEDTGRTRRAFWQDESFDHRVRDEAELDRIVHYVEYNPVSAGLAANPRNWHWSSGVGRRKRLPHKWREPSRNVETPGVHTPNSTSAPSTSSAGR